MIGRRTLPSGAFVRELSAENGLVYVNYEAILPSGSRAAHLKASGPVAYDLSQLAAAEHVRVLLELIEHLHVLDMLHGTQRRSARNNPPRRG